MKTLRIGNAVALVVAVTGCGSEQPVEGLRAFVGATIIDGTGGAPVDNGVIVVRDGRIEAVGAASAVDVPSGAERVDLGGRYIIPGLINTHGHVGGVRGLENGFYNEDNLLRQLGLYARYGVTAVNSLGGDEGAGFALRDAQDTPDLQRGRLYVAGAVVVGDTPEAAMEMVEGNAALGADFIKIRVDDNLGTTDKMTPDVYAAVVDRAHELNLPVAAHLFYLDDAKGLLEAGVDFVVHSVRDHDVDDELADLLTSHDVCYSPTLTREVSTFVYEDVPEFFDDPFFLREADPDVLEQLQDPRRMEGVRARSSTPRYKEALDVAMRNVKALSDAGVTIAFGTDTGPAARFQGYFEHMEMALMAEAGMSPTEILASATGDAAACIGRDDIGTLRAGNWADLVVLRDDPTADIANARSIESVWIAGNEVPGSAPS